MCTAVVQVEDKGSNTMPLYVDTAMCTWRALSDAKLAYQPESHFIVLAHYIIYIHLFFPLTRSYHTVCTSLQVWDHITFTHYNHDHPFISSLTSMV